MSECNNLGMFGIQRCKFEPRYDVSEPIFPAGVKINFFNAEDWKRNTYVRDVCVRCGKTIERVKA